MSSELEDARAAFPKELGVQIDELDFDDLPLIEGDLREIDRIELASTWRKNTSAELYATFVNYDEGYRLTAPSVPGMMIFGVTEHRSGLGQVWMLQSLTFNEAISSDSEGRLLRILTVGGRAMTDKWADQYQCVFNFARTDNKDTLIWLRRIGFRVEPASRAEDTMCLFYKGNPEPKILRDPSLIEGLLGQPAGH